MADVDAAGEGLDRAVGADGIGERGESWEAIQREVDFRDVAGGADVADAKRECWVELRRINEIEERALGVDAGDDGFGGDFFAVGEDDSSDGVVLDSNVLDVSLRSNFGAGSACGFRESTRESAEPTFRERCGANGM